MASVDSWAYPGEAFNKRHPVRSGAVNPRLKTHTQAKERFSTWIARRNLLVRRADTAFPRNLATGPGIHPLPARLWRKG